MQFKLNFALVAIAIASASVSAMPTRGYASDSNDLAARATADDLAYLEARYGADVDVNEFFGREDEADLFARDDDAESLFARDDDADSLFAREDDTDSLFAREDEGELFAREDEGELFAREDAEDLWAREDEAEFYARDFADYADLEARQLIAPAAPPSTPAAPASPNVPPRNPLKPTDPEGLLGWKFMKAAVARNQDPLPANQAHAFTEMREGCKRATDPAVSKHCLKVVKHLEAAAGEQLWGFRTYLEMTSNTIPVSVLPYLSQITPHAENINTKLAPGLTPLVGVPSPKA
jgi:hypothetical protein